MKMRTSSRLARWLALAACAMAGAAQGALFKCVAKDGAVSYQADPCPVVADEKKMKEPAPGPVRAAGSASPWKEGWTADEVTAMANLCVPGVIGPARRDFVAASAAQGANARFPEDELTPPVKAMCLCFAKRIGATYSRADFDRDRAAILRKMNDEAVNGGACKPEGLLGEVMERSRRN